MGSLWRRLRWFRRRSTVVGAAGGSRVRISRGRWRASPRRVWIVRRYIQVPKFPPLGIILGSLQRIAQDLMRSLDLLKLCHVFLLAAWIPIGMAFQRELSESLADLVLVCVGRDAQVCVVIPSSISLHHGDGEYTKRVEDVTERRARAPVLVAVQADATVLLKVVSHYFTVWVL